MLSRDLLLHPFEPGLLGCLPAFDSEFSSRSCHAMFMKRKRILSDVRRVAKDAYPYPSCCLCGCAGNAGAAHKATRVFWAAWRVNSQSGLPGAAMHEQT